MNVAQNSANLKFAMDILDKCVYNTTYAADLMSVVLSYVILDGRIYLQIE